LTKSKQLVVDLVPRKTLVLHVQTQLARPQQTSQHAQIGRLRADKHVRVVKQAQVHQQPRHGLAWGFAGVEKPTRGKPKLDFNRPPQTPFSTLNKRFARLRRRPNKSKPKTCQTRQSDSNPPPPPSRRPLRKPPLGLPPTTCLFFECEPQFEPSPHFL